MIKTAKKTERIEKMTKDTDTEIALLKRDVETIRDNHLAHMAEDIDKLDKKIDKIDNRIWAILGLLIASVLAPMIANMF